MITNEKQYKITKSQAKKFEDSLRSFDKSSKVFENVHPKIVEAQKTAMEEQLQDLYDEIREYDELKSGRINYNTGNILEDLPVLLIKARIANNLTQADLASKLDMKVQQIQRYESQRYSTASLSKLRIIASALGVEPICDVSGNIFSK